MIYLFRFITIIFLVVFSNLVILDLISPGSLQINKNWAQCLDYIKRNDVNTVLIGTSVSREMTKKATFKLVDDMESEIFNCGLSAHTTSLNFHESLLYSVLDTSSAVKEVLIGISIQDLINDDDYSIKLIGTSPFSIESLYFIFTDSKYKLDDGKWVDALIKIFFPLSRVDLLGLIDKEYTFTPSEVGGHKNSPQYRKEVFSMEKIKEGEIDMLKRKGSLFSAITKLKKIKSRAKKYGVKVRYILLPQNYEYLKLGTRESSIKKSRILLNHTFNDILDFSFLVKPEGFADCCHLNDSGRKELEKRVIK